MAHVREQDDDDSIPAFVLVLGRTGVAKSTFFKAVTGLDVQIGDNIHSCEVYCPSYRLRNSRD